MTTIARLDPSVEIFDALLPVPDFAAILSPLKGFSDTVEAFVRIPRTSPDAISLPATPSARSDRAARLREAMVAIRAFADRAHEGFSSAADYRTARRSLLDDACGGDALVFFAAWNCLLAEGALAPLLQAPVGTVRKPARRRPVAILPRTQLTLQLAEGRIVFDLGMIGYSLLPP